MFNTLNNYNKRGGFGVGFNYNSNFEHLICDIFKF